MPEPYNIFGDASLNLFIEDNVSRIDDIGEIEYQAEMSSGTGINECNKVWYEERTIAGIHDTDLLNLPVNRLGVQYHTSFKGAGSGNVKGLHIENTGSTPIYFSFPFSGFSGYNLVSPSSSYLLSNINGYEVPASSADIRASGSGSYNISLMGAILPIFLDIQHSLPIESLQGLNVDNTSCFENLGSVAHSTVGPIEWLIANSSLDYGVNFESSMTLNLDDIVNFESKASLDIDNQLHIEFTLPNASGNELLQNIQFYPTDSGLVNEEWNEVNASSIDPWTFTFDEHTEFEDIDQETKEITFNNSFSIYRYTANGSGGYVHNVAMLSSESPSDFTMAQAVTVTPGLNYRVTFRYDSEIGTVAPTGTFTLKDTGNTVVVSDQSDTGVSASDGSYKLYTYDFSPTGSNLSLEWNVPQQNLAYDDDLNAYENLATYRNVWFIKSPSLKQID